MGEDVSRLYDKLGHIDAPYQDIRAKEHTNAVVGSSQLLRESVKGHESWEGRTGKAVALPINPDLKILCFLSCSGGVGRTTMLANLANIYASQGKSVVVVDFDPNNMLSLHMGLEPQHHDGIAKRWADGGAWNEAGLCASDGIHLVPFGFPDQDGLTRFEAMLLAEPLWLRSRLAELAMPEPTLLLIDVPPLPSIFARQAALAADLVAGVLRPDATAPLMLSRLDNWLAAFNAPSAESILLCGFHPGRPLHSAVADLLRLALKQRLSPLPIHYDSAVPEALAAALSVIDIAPDSQVVHDLYGLAKWLEHKISSTMQAAA